DEQPRFTCNLALNKELTMSEEVILFPILFSLIGFVIWTIFSTIRRYKTTPLQAGLQTKLLEKFGSGQELLAYVQSDAGKRFLESLTMEQRTPYRRILGAAQASVVLILLAFALLFLRDRKSTRLNSSHVAISYAVFCLKKKNN